jgi:hypothetical protein
MCGVTEEITISSRWGEVKYRKWNSRGIWNLFAIDPPPNRKM